MNLNSPRPIRLLPPALCNQIAAGEVVERPASVLKELLENSIDAGASEITVILEDGGQTMLAVRDNGHGIPKADLELAVTRHATSKLASFQDLLTVASYGFRGEALPSIASVSELKLESAYSPEGSSCDHGAFIRVRHGEVVDSGPSSIQKGTTITVSDIFANVPARLKFLKTPATELKRCQEVLLRLALARQDIGFSLKAGKISDGKSREIFRLHAGQTLRERLQQLWPPLITEGLIPFSGERGGIKAHGLASLPQAAQTKGDRMLLYVNGRPVNDRLLLRAVREAYKGRLTSKEFPQIVLFLDIDPQDVDVNVHPAKIEVRFRDERAVFGSVLRIIEAGFSGYPHSFGGFSDSHAAGEARAPDTDEHEASNHQAGQIELPPLYTNGSSLSQARKARRPDGFWGSLDSPRLVDPTPSHEIDYTEEVTPPTQTSTPYSVGMPENSDNGEGILSSGKSFKDYRPMKVAEPVDPFCSFESTPSSVKSGSFSTEESENIEPSRDSNHGGHVEKDTGGNYPVSVGPLVCLGQIDDSYLIIIEKDELLLLDQHAAHERILLHTIEQEVSSSQSQLLVIPVELSLHHTESETLMEALPSLTNIGFDLATEQGKLVVRGVPPLLGRSGGLAMLKDLLANRTDGIDDMLHLMACHSAIRAGQKLTSDEAAGLLRRWLETPDREFCPHGRPIVLRFGKYELEKLFKRK